MSKQVNKSKADEAADILKPPEELDVGIAALGIHNIQFHHGLDPMDVIRGDFKDSLGNRTFRSVHNLTSDDAVRFMHSALELKAYSYAVGWAKAALKAAKAEGRPKEVINNRKKMLIHQKKVHDNVIENRGWLHYDSYEGDGLPLLSIVNKDPYNKRLLLEAKVQNHIKERTAKRQKFEAFKHSNIKNDLSWNVFKYFTLSNMINNCNGVQVGT